MSHKVKDVEDLSLKSADPARLLPEESISYEMKSKMKTRTLLNQEDSFNVIEEKTEIPLKPIEMEYWTGVKIKFEECEEDLDCDDFTNDDDLLKVHYSEDNQEPAVKLEQQDCEGEVSTYETEVKDNKSTIGYSQAVAGPVTESGYVCNTCPLVFQSLKSLKSHQSKKHKMKHICDHCGMSYEIKASLIVHVKRKHGPKSMCDDKEDRICDICALVFKGMARLRMHMRRKHGFFKDLFQHVCKECGLTYDKFRSLVVHIQRKHTTDKKPAVDQWHKCPFCSKVFTKRETYARHVQRKHRVKNEDITEVENVDKNLLENCKNEVTGEMACLECPRVFTSLNFLKLHMRRKHNALRESFKLKCRICSLSYDKIDSLKRHITRKHE